MTMPPNTMVPKSKPAQGHGIASEQHDNGGGLTPINVCAFFGILGWPFGSRGGRLPCFLMEK